MGLIFLNAGSFTTIQDLGRLGMQHEGFSPGGAMDSFSLKIANLLVGNNLGEACIEMTAIGAKIEFDEDAIIAITGADMEPKIKGQGVPALWKTNKINAGEIIEFGKAKTGFRSYLSVKGIFDIPQIFGSKSTTNREKIGGIDGKGKIIENGDRIYLKEESILDICNDFLELKDKYIPKYNEIIKKVRVLKGPYEDHFTKKGIQTFYSSVYEVSNHVDRTGYRLFGNHIEHQVDAGRMISGGMITGAIQVPGDASPIVLTVERRTHGGYPTIATIISVDLPIISQSKPGDKIKFVEVTQEEAIKELEREKIFFDNFKYFTINFNEKLFNIPNIF